jgi:hypothetical protein
VNKIRDIFKNKVNGGSFISIDSITDVKLAGGKGNPFQGRVKKLTVGSNVMVFQNKNTNAYEAMVKRRLTKEGKDPETFVLSPRSWGVREIGTPFVTHNEKEYLEVIFLKCGEVKYTLDGQPVDKYLILGLPERSQEAEQGGLSDQNKVIIRTYSFDSIVKVTIDGKEHII